MMARYFRSYGGLTAILILTCLAYSNSFAGVMVFDDLNFIKPSDAIQRWWEPWRLFQGDGFNRPVGYLTFALNFAAHGWNVWGFHLVNLAIHLANVACLYFVFCAVLDIAPLVDIPKAKRTTIAIGALAIWSVHPIQVQSVTFIYQRLESLAALFILLTLLFYLRNRVAPSWWSFISCVTCGILGMLTKETAVVAPIMIFVLDAVAFERNWGEPFRRRPVLLFALFSTLAIPVAMVILGRTQLMNLGVLSGGASVRVSRWQYLFAQGVVICKYLRLLVWPDGLCVFRGMQSAIPVGEGVGPFTVLVCVFLAALWGMLRLRLWALAVFLFFLLLAPSSSFIPIRDLMYDHRVYLPSFLCSISFVMGITWQLDWLQSRLRFSTRWNSTLVFLLIAGTALAFATTTYQRNRIFSSKLAFWQDCYDKSPCDLSVNNIAEVLEEENRLDDALKLLLIASERFPESALIRDYIARCYLKIGDDAAAIRFAQDAVERQPDVGDFYWTLAAAMKNRAKVDLEAAFAMMENMKKSVALDRKWKRTSPSREQQFKAWSQQFQRRQEVFAQLEQWRSDVNVPGSTILAQAQRTLQQGDALAAAYVFEFAIERCTDLPDKASAMAFRGRIAAMQGDLALAEQWTKRALELAPDALALTTLGDLLQLKQDSGAEDLYQRALQQNDGLAEARMGYIRLLLAQGRNQEANEQQRILEKMTPQRPSNSKN